MSSNLTNSDKDHIYSDKFIEFYEKFSEFNKCKGCGKCCANILMLHSKEIDAIKKYISKNNIKPINRNNVFQTVNVCPFLSENNKCLIYPVRSEMCQKFSCDKSEQEELNYKGIKAINMLLTFFPNEYCSNPPDLTEINDRIKKLVKKI
jgi:Fe-S-cluster containining protein